MGSRAMGGHSDRVPEGARLSRGTGPCPSCGWRMSWRGGGTGKEGHQPDTGSRSRERCEVPKGSIAILISYKSILTCHGQLGRLTPELRDLINGLSKPYL